MVSLQPLVSLVFLNNWRGTFAIGVRDCGCARTIISPKFKKAKIEVLATFINTSLPGALRNMQVASLDVALLLTCMYHK